MGQSCRLGGSGDCARRVVPDRAMRHFVNLSGGAGSWYTGRRVIETHTSPGDEVHLVFADTNMEDEDLYRFLEQCVADLRILGEWYEVSVTYTRLADGRDVWDVFNDVKFLGNSRIDPCSKILKRDLIRKHLEENFSPEDTTCYIGIDWTEEHRFLKAVPHWKPFTVKAPLCEPPYVDKAAILSHMEGLGIRQPRLYEMGFPHNNCGGFCVKAGHGAFKLLLEKMPERYAYHEQREQEFREHLGKDVAILKDRTLAAKLAKVGLRECDVEVFVEQTQGYSDEYGWHEPRETELLVHRETQTVIDLPNAVPLTLLQLRKRVENGGEVDEFDIGGCACFTPDFSDDVDNGTT